MWRTVLDQFRRFLRPVTTISKILTPILPIVYRGGSLPVAPAWDEHGPDDESFFFLLATGGRSKLRNEPKASHTGVPRRPKQRIGYFEKRR